MPFRLSLGLARAALGVSWAWMPTNHLVRWIYTDRGLKWGLPIAVVLVPIYYQLGRLAQARIEDGGSSWWWLALAWAVVNCVKFTSVGIRTPFVWAYRAVRRALARIVGRVTDKRERVTPRDFHPTNTGEPVVGELAAPMCVRRPPSSTGNERTHDGPRPQHHPRPRHQVSRRPVRRE
jgi:hypothetical protein